MWRSCGTVIGGSHGLGAAPPLAASSPGPFPGAGAPSVGGAGVGEVTIVTGTDGAVPGVAASPAIAGSYGRSSGRASAQRAKGRLLSAGVNRLRTSQNDSSNFLRVESRGTLDFFSRSRVGFDNT